MSKYGIIKARKGFFRIRCIEAIEELLTLIGPKWKPTTYIPSLYLRKIIKD